MPYQPNQRGTGFINWGQVFGVNQGGAQRLAEGVAAPIEAAGQAVQSGLSNYDSLDSAGQDKLRSQADDTARRATLAGSTAGLGALIGEQRQGSGGFYSPGMARFDSALAQTAGGNRLQGLGRYSGLSRAFDTTASDTTNKDPSFENAPIRRKAGAAQAALDSNAGDFEPVGTADRIERRRRRDSSLGQGEV